MRKIVGLDLSITSAGWFLRDGKKKLTYGSFKTQPKDGIDIKRLMIQRDRIVNLFNENEISHIGIERPFWGSYNTEKLYSLHQFILEVCYTRNIKVVYISPAQIKTYAIPGKSKASKGEMVIATKEALGMTKGRINNDECDAYWVSLIAERFWQFYYNEITEEELTEAEKYIFIRTKTNRPGIIKKENDSFYIF